MTRRLISAPNPPPDRTGRPGSAGTPEAMAHARATLHRMRRWSREDVIKHEEAVSLLLRTGTLSRAEIKARLHRPPPLGLGLSLVRTQKIISRIEDRWRTEDYESRALERSKQIRRLKASIQETQGRRDPNNPTVWLERPNHQSRVRYEDLFARIAGTLAPIEIDINIEHREVMVAVFAQYTLEELEALHAVAEQKHRLAAAYVAEHPDAIIDVEAHAAEE